MPFSWPPMRQVSCKALEAGVRGATCLDLLPRSLVSCWSDNDLRGAQRLHSEHRTDPRVHATCGVPLTIQSEFGMRTATGCGLEQFWNSISAVVVFGSFAAPPLCVGASIQLSPSRSFHSADSMQTAEQPVEVREMSFVHNKNK